jgi:hypothetical protein
MEITKKEVLVLAIVLVFASFLVFASAAEQGKNRTGNETDKETTGVKNMTYGQCVSEAAKVKNTCYSGIKTIYQQCKDNAKNQTDSKTASKQCNADYKKSMAQCKSDFKGTKKQECAKIKHNFLETMGSMFK